jgi:hypothetical protein
MTVAQKVFWFFAGCLVLNIGLSLAGVAPVNTYSTKDPVPDMSREAQCETSKWYVRYWTYNGQLIAKDTIQCFNNLVIRTEKM